MKMTRDMYQRLTLIEAKAVRRVRTPAGVAKYGQPLGTIIRADSIVARAKRKAPASAMAARKTKTTLKESRDFSKVPATPNSKPLRSLDDLKWMKDPLDELIEYAKFGPMVVTKQTYPPAQDWQKEATVTHNLSMGRQRVEVPYAFSEHDRNIQTTRTLNKYRHVLEPKRTPRETSSLMDYWEGIYGWDWMNEDDDITEEDFESKVKRQFLANQESQELGITVNGMTTAKGIQAVDVGVHETINAMMRAYNDMYPGITNLISEFTLSKTPLRGAIAWNGRRMKAWGHDESYMGLNAAYWGATDDNSAVDNLTAQKDMANKSNWGALKGVDEFAEEHDIDRWQAAALQTLNHEMGHSVARSIFGELKYPGIDNEEWALYYGETIAPILLKYGIVKDESYALELDTTNWQVSQGRSTPRAKSKLPAGWDKVAMSGHLSEYGSTNMHEVMAETWASFMMDSEPTEFVQELGEAMEQMFLTWLDEAGIE